MCHFGRILFLGMDHFPKGGWWQGNFLGHDTFFSPLGCACFFRWVIACVGICSKVKHRTWKKALAWFFPLGSPCTIFFSVVFTLQEFFVAKSSVFKMFSVDTKTQSRRAFQKAQFSWRISVDARLNCRIKAALSIFSFYKWMKNSSSLISRHVPFFLWTKSVKTVLVMFIYLSTSLVFQLLIPSLVTFCRRTFTSAGTQTCQLIYPWTKVE